MQKLTFFRLIAQVASFILAISLRNISEEVLGTYAISLSILSVFSAVITYEGTFLVISRNIYPSNFFTNLKVNRPVWLLVTALVLYIGDLGPIITMCLLGFLLTLDFEYLVNITTLGERAHGEEVRFRKLLGRKIIFAEFLFPLLSFTAIYLNLVWLLLPIYIIIFLFLNIYLFIFAGKKSKRQPLSKAIPTFKGTLTAFLKRTDSQLQRLVIGSVFGASVLGSIYPALLIGRAGSIIGNVWYTYYFNRTKQVISAGHFFIRNIIAIIFGLIVICSLYAFFSQWFFSYFFDWNVEVIIYSTFFFINLQFLYKTFIRSITTNIRKINFFNIALSVSILIKLIYAGIFNINLTSWLFLSILVDLIVFWLLQLYIYFIHRNEDSKSNINVLRVTNLPTEDFPASGLTSHMISEGTDELIAIPFPKKLCLFNYDDKKIISELKIDLRSKKLFKWVRLFISIYYSYRLSRVAVKNNINIIHVHWVPLIFIKLFSSTNKKFIMTIHGEDARYLDYFPFKQIARKYSKIYVVGSYWTDYLKQKNFKVEEIANFSPIEDELKNNLKNNLIDYLSKEETKLCVIASEKSHKNLKIFQHIPQKIRDALESSNLAIEVVGISEDYYKKVTVNNKIPNGIILPGRLSRYDTLFSIISSDLLLIPSYTEGNPKVVWEAVELGTFPIISKTLTFHGFNHKNYPFRFNPDNSEEFWETINNALLEKDKLDLEDFFTISSHLTIRNEYNRSYKKTFREYVDVI